MRASLSVLFVLAAAAPAVAQPSATPPVADVMDAPEPPYAQPAPTYAPAPQPVYYVPGYYYTAYQPPVVVMPPAPPKRPHGVYFSESFAGVNVSDELGNSLDGGVRFRVAIGYRRNNLAFELWGAGGLLWGRDEFASRSGYLSTDTIQPTNPGSHYTPNNDGFAQVGVDVKYLKTLSKNFEIYGRAGLGRAAAGSVGAGNGIGLGAGAQLKGKVPVIGFLFWPLFFTGIGPKCTAAIFTETGYEFYRLHNDVRSTDAQLTSWTVGFAVGSDF